MKRDMLQAMREISKGSEQEKWKGNKEAHHGDANVLVVSTIHTHSARYIASNTI